jgi:hypothetical protein
MFGDRKQQTRMFEELNVLRASALFDPIWYLETYPDVRINAAQHYISYGASEGRNPHPLFETTFYKKQYLDLDATGVNPLVHYLTIGWRHGARPSELFDPSWYLEQNPDVKRAGVEPLSHYIQRGWREKRRPSSSFDLEKYVAERRDLDGYPADPLTHYQTIGRKEGIRPTGIFHLNDRPNADETARGNPMASAATGPAADATPSFSSNSHVEGDADADHPEEIEQLQYAGLEPLIERTGRPRVMLDATDQSENTCLVDAFLALAESPYEIWCIYPGRLKSWMRPDMLFDKIPARELPLYFASVDVVILAGMHPLFQTYLRAYLSCGVVPLAASDQLNDTIISTSEALGLNTGLPLAGRIDSIFGEDRLLQLSALARTLCSTEAA